MDFNTLVKTYGSIGAGGLSLVALIWILVYLVTKINPILQSLKTTSEVQSKIIENNTDAIKEVSKSNENVATALALLNHSFATFSQMMEKHDHRAEGMENELIKIGENVRLRSEIKKAVKKEINKE